MQLLEYQIFLFHTIIFLYMKIFQKANIQYISLPHMNFQYKICNHSNKTITSISVSLYRTVILYVGNTSYLGIDCRLDARYCS